MEEKQLISWFKLDSFRMECLHVASQLHLENWCIAAGFIRNFTWDKLHGYSEATDLEDIDLIYLNPNQLDKQYDLELESRLPSYGSGPKWSVKNQARMNLKNQHPNYSSLVDAMRFWPETCTSLGISLEGGSLKLISAYGLQDLFDLKICRSPMTTLTEDQIYKRIYKKQWLLKWPLLTINLTSTAT